MPFHAKKAYLAEKAPQIARNNCTVDKWAIQWLFLFTAINKTSRQPLGRNRWQIA